MFHMVQQQALMMMSSSAHIADADDRRRVGGLVAI